MSGIEVYKDKAIKLAREKDWRRQNPEAYRALRRRWYHRAKNKPKALSTYLKCKYGITLNQYGEMLQAQGGVCKICMEPPGKKRLAVDHCHDTLKVRGLLCSNCNSFIGMAKHSILILESAIIYLKGDS